MKEDWNPFTRRVCTVAASIPHGKVATYGQIARLAGNPGGARQVARILHTLSDAQKLPWHRVISAGGYIKTPHPFNDIQRYELQKEGVSFLAAYQVDVDTFLWDVPYDCFLY